MLDRRDDLPGHQPLATAPTPRWIQLTALLLAVAGVCVSAYLTYEHVTSGTTLACPDTGVVNCVKVTTSDYSRFLGIPVAVLGLAFFIGMTLLCLPVTWRAPGPWWGRARLAASASGVLFVLYLVWAELFRVDAVCLWCTAVHLLALALFAVIAVGHALQTPPSSDGTSPSPSLEHDGRSQ